MPSKKGAAKAEAKPESKPESKEEKPVEAQKEEPKEAVEETKNPEPAAKKGRGRGRPKKDGSSEPTAKKPKKVKEPTEPSRVSRRVANMKSGVTEPEPDTELPKKKVTKKAQPTVQEEKKELSASNGAPEQVVIS